MYSEGVASTEFNSIKFNSIFLLCTIYIIYRVVNPIYINYYCISPYSRKYTGIYMYYIGAKK